MPRGDRDQVVGNGGKEEGANAGPADRDAGGKSATGLEVESDTDDCWQVDQAEAKATEVFEKIDRDNSGTITYPEAKGAVKWALKHGELKKEDVPAAKKWFGTIARIGKTGLTKAISQW